jgi:alpha-galactosidase
MILTVIGGGSSQWMKSLMRDVYFLDEVGGGEIRLVDPKRDNVEAVARMLETFNKVRNKDYKISVTNDRREALKHADFVMTTFSPGSMDAFYHDLEVPIKYGIRIPVSMTVGPPGISAALRTAPIAYEIVEDMEAMCPGAWLLNVTNPMSVVHAGDEQGREDGQSDWLLS